MLGSEWIWNKLLVVVSSQVVVFLDLALFSRSPCWYMGHCLPSTRSKAAYPINMQASSTKHLSLSYKPTRLLEGRQSEWSLFSDFLISPDNISVLGCTCNCLQRTCSGPCSPLHTLLVLPRLQATPGGRTTWNLPKVPELRHLNSSTYRLAIQISGV